MTPEKPSNNAQWAIAGALLGLTVTVGAAGKAIVQEISRGNSFYVCTELWKLGGDSHSCDVFVKEPERGQ